ncbi:Uu.00g025570.m01.CDS01 [Anthostomella pinea]|uniref:Uu.00g025570.m01.CDS01 n=1 Tax=Anthostomella pinea TaxID=933095 RepID=A0AAI8V781_9PEZI|nr:Uu.00g025570.m01.CDS01 [Anthostomella pinea]
MERKRKLPARAAARVDHVNKKRTTTPPEPSVTPSPPEPLSVPVPVPDAAPVPEEPQLPRSIQAGNPLPTVENPQPDDLPAKDYQSIQESGVLAESLARSRQKWINEGIFEKYWTKPTKRKGVKEEPNNPAKDTMAKIGQITINVEPYQLEATMFAVKDPKLSPTTNSTFRPVMQYGPPNGVMPLPPKPGTPSSLPPAPPVQASPSQPPAPSQAPPQSTPRQQPQQQQQQSPPPSAPALATPQPLTQPPQPSSAHPQSQYFEPHRPPSSAAMSKPLASPRGLESVLAAPQRSPAPGPTIAPPQPPPPSHANGPSQPGMTMNRPLHAPSPTAAPAGPGPALPPGAKPTAPTAPGADPIIVTLAEKASEDPHLRDLMKRVAVGEAAPPELAHFQRIIDQITIEYKKKGGQQGPSADRLIVDGKTVKYFADEVRTILDIVLASNPQQRSIGLRPPPGSDPLVILLVKEALDKPTTRDMVRRVAEGRTKFSDALELKSILDKLKDMVVKETAKDQQATLATPQLPASLTNGIEPPSGAPNGIGPRKSSVSGVAHSPNAPASQQALRSKGPLPSVKSDISAIVLEFSSGTGDRYMFPKYSILEYSAGGSQVIASFLIVRKGSRLEYGGDPTLDYYQPMTIRISSHSGKHLENLARVVAPQDEVRRYMDDVMDNMTRAEFVLLAMRLPRAEKEDQIDDQSDTPRAELSQQPPQPGVLWDVRPTPLPTAPPNALANPPPSEDAQYQGFITTVS